MQTGREENKRAELTEHLATQFMKQNRVYTIRNDMKDEIWIYIDGIYIPHGRSYLREFCRTKLKETYIPYLVSDVIHKVAVDTFIDEEDFFHENSTEEICILNGLLNLKTRKLVEFSPDKIFFNKLPIVYDPQADCPAIETHFQAVLKNPSDKEVLYELFGFCLYKEYFIEKALMLLGDGRNGKGKTIELLKNFLGAENCASVPLQQLESENFARCELFKKLANLCGDLSHTALKTTGIFKQLTGRDLISADRKFLPRIHFKNYAKLVFACNELPRTGDLTPAFWNRWILLEFPYTFLPKKEYDKQLADTEISEAEKNNIKLADPEIIQKLTTQTELSGILNKALDGLDKLSKKKDFSFSKSTADIKLLWLRKSDSITVFVSEKIEEGDINSDYIPKNQLKRKYVSYCREQKARISSDKDIKSALESNFDIYDKQITGDNSERIRVWQGIKWKEPAQGEHDAQGNSSSQIGILAKTKNDRVKNRVQGVNPVQSNDKIQNNDNTVSTVLPSEVQENIQKQGKPVDDKDGIAENSTIRPLSNNSISLIYHEIWDKSKEMDELPLEEIISIYKKHDTSTVAEQEAKDLIQKWVKQGFAVQGSEKDTLKLLPKFSELIN